MIHFDGKSLPPLDSKENVDRQSIVISFNGNKQLIGVSLIKSGTGKERALTV